MSDGVPTKPWGSMSMWSDPGLYTDFFGLDERPFTLLPDPDFLFWSEQHKRAFAVLEYGILSRAPITLITGEIGAGKTTLLQALLRNVDDDVTIGLVSNAQGGRGELVAWILSALDVAVERDLDYVAMFRMLQDLLIEEYASGRRVILIFDEAQNLSLEGLEELQDAHQHQLQQGRTAATGPRRPAGVARDGDAARAAPVRAAGRRELPSAANGPCNRRRIISRTACESPAAVATSSRPRLAR